MLIHFVTDAVDHKVPCWSGVTSLGCPPFKKQEWEQKWDWKKKREWENRGREKRKKEKKWIKEGTRMKDKKRNDWENYWVLVPSALLKDTVVLATNCPSFDNCVSWTWNYFSYTLSDWFVERYNIPFDQLPDSSNGMIRLWKWYTCHKREHETIFLTASLICSINGRIFVLRNQ